MAGIAGLRQEGDWGVGKAHNNYQEYNLLYPLQLDNQQN
jgi:hypothetical protein